MLTAPTFSFRFATFGDGMISQWSADVLREGPAGNSTIQTINPILALDRGVLAGQGEGRVFSRLGSWTTSAVPDAGSSLALLSLSLTALGLVARRFQRAAG